MDFGTFGQGFAYATISLCVAVIWTAQVLNRVRRVYKGPLTIRDEKVAAEGEEVRVIVESVNDNDFWPLMMLILIASYAWPLTALFVIARWLLNLPIKLYQKWSTKVQS